MKRSTLILLLVAIVGGVLVYYLEFKPGKPRDEEPDKTKPAFNFSREDITSIALTRGGSTVNLENQNGKWVITQPVNAAADESAMNALVSDLVSARIDREFPAQADSLKSYGLAEPAVKLEIKLKNGQTRRVELGTRDVEGNSAYSKIDGSQNVAMLPVGVLTNADKSLNDLRDRTVLGATQFELSSIRLNGDAGPIELVKQEAEWKLKSPVETAAEENAVSTLLNDLTSAKAVEIVSETADDLPKYGLDKPGKGLTAKLATGAERSISIGSKVDDKYYAKASDRPQIFKVDQAFLDKLNTKLSSLRSRDIFKFNKDDLKSISIKNSNGTISAENKDGKWIVTEPADKKDKEAMPFKLFTPFESKALEVLDKATPAISAKLAKPAAEVRLTDKAGKTTLVRISAADGDDCYVQIEGRTEIFKLSKLMLESLNFKIDEAIQS